MSMMRAVQKWLKMTDLVICRGVCGGHGFWDNLGVVVIVYLFETVA